MLDEKGWSNNPGGTIPNGRAGLVASDGCPKAWGEGGLSTVVTPVAKGFVGGELEGGEPRQPFFFFFGTGLNGMSGESTPAASLSS